MPTHLACHAGAVVRLHGTVPAVVESIRREMRYGRACLMATARVTGRPVPNPHGYRIGQRVTLHAFLCVPRDCITGENRHGPTWADFPIFED